ncbi:hypothetical protein JCM10212_002671 [Sporobolomyces blumeae]
MIDDPALAYPTPHPTPIFKFESPPSSSSLSLSPASDPTSSTSPSPPLDLCERVEDVKPDVKETPKRTTPCERCRQVRRACRWDEGSKSCVRCSEAGIACSGPKRRSKPAHEMIVSVAARRELPVVEIGPSSPESRWSTLHLSYSLQYHLLDIALPHAEGLCFDGLDFRSFLCRFRSSLGRNDEFDSLEQLFALDLMVLGGHSTNHSAFLRTASPVPELASLAASTIAVTPARYAEIGLSRQQPLLFLVGEIVRHAFDHLSQRFDTSERAVTVLSAVALAVNFVTSAGDVEDDCLDLVELAVRRGLEFLHTSIPPLPPEDSLFEPLRELTVRRACRWDEGSKSCVRCSEAGIACSGPKRRSKPAHEMIVSVAARRELPVVEIGPSSPESRWSTVHLSYSLQYHLVDTALDFLQSGADFGIIDYPTFLAEFRSARGRHGEMDEVHQLFATAQMVAAGHFTTHSAFVRLSSPAPPLESVSGSEAFDPGLIRYGLARREPLAAINAQIATLTERQLARSSGTLAEVTKTLTIVLFACQFFEDSADFAQDRLGVLSSASKRGLEHLSRADPPVPDDHQLLEITRELVVQEIQQALSLGASTSISPSAYRFLFGEPAVPPMPISPDDLWFVFEPGNPVASGPSWTFHSSWIPSLGAVWTDLSRILAYAPTSSTFATVRYCWRRNDELLAVCDSVISRVAADPRFSSTTPPRPRIFLQNLVYAEVETLRLLWSCHIKLERTTSFALQSSSLQFESEQRLFRGLDLVARRLSLCIRTAASKTQAHSFAIRLVEVIRLVSADLLQRWAVRSPSNIFE